ncbi:MAG: alkaline phosphatase family protein [Microbacterium sp.]
MDPPAARSLTGIVPQMIASLSGAPGWFPAARSAIIVLVDGLGRGNLTACSGHARFLTSHLGKKDAARTVFPSTTATALTSLLTGTVAGEHGIVGYRARVPGTSTTPNQLKDWRLADRQPNRGSPGTLDPLSWQRSTPLLEREARAGRPVFIVSQAKYAGSGFTQAIQRGATFIAGATAVDRLDAAAELAARHPGALVYAYLPELDTIGHARGWASDAWVAGLEVIDAGIRRLAERLDATTGVVVTADHGMVDVPARGHLLLQSEDALLDEVDLVAGEPRMLHLYADSPGAPARVVQRWREREAGRAWIMTRDEAIAAGLFGARVDREVAPRIGDVLVAARGAVAYYDDRVADKKAQTMIGQHGSLTDQERIVPLIRLGVFAR